MVKKTLKEIYELKKLNEMNLLLREARDKEKAEELRDFIEKIQELSGNRELGLIPSIKRSFEKLREKLLDFLKNNTEKKFFGFDKLFGGFPGTDYKKIREFFKEIQNFISQLRQTFISAKKNISTLKGKDVDKNTPIKKLLNESKRRKAILNELKNLNLRFKRRMKESKTTSQRIILKEAFQILKEATEGGGTKEKAISFVQNLINQIEAFNNEQECFKAIKEGRIEGLKIEGEELILELKVEESESSTELEGLKEFSKNFQDFITLTSQADLKMTEIFEDDDKKEFLKEITELSISQLESVVEFLTPYLEEAERSADNLIEFDDDNGDKKDKNEEQGKSIHLKLLDDAQKDSNVIDDTKEKIKKAIESKDKKQIDDLVQIIANQRFGEKYQEMMKWFKKQKLLKNQGEN